MVQSFFERKIMQHFQNLVYNNKYGKLQKFICDIVIKFYFYHSINTSSNSNFLP